MSMSFDKSTRVTSRRSDSWEKCITIVIPAENVNTRQLERIISSDTKQQCMKTRNIPVTHVTIKQLKKGDTFYPTVRSPTGDPG